MRGGGSRPRSDTRRSVAVVRAVRHSALSRHCLVARPGPASEGLLAPAAFSSPEAVHIYMMLVHNYGILYAHNDLNELSTENA